MSEDTLNSIKKDIMFYLYYFSGCKDNKKWTDHRYGDANNLSRCVDLTLDYCNNVEKYKEAYTTEARKHCPKACGLC